MAGTQLPSSVLSFTSPILDRAVKTGGWGMTIKHHDPGKIGDAFFKKAQLDLGIANLQAELGVKKAQILSSLEMQNAQLDLDKSKILLDYTIKDRTLKLAESQNDVGFFEGLFGTIAGAAQGAAGNAAIGGSPWVGAAVGAAATGLGYATEGRKGGIAAREAIGAVSMGASAIKEMGEKQKARDAWTSLMQSGSDILSRMNTGSPQQRLAATGEYEGFKQKMFQFQVDQMRMNPAEAAQAVAGYDQAMRGKDPWGSAMMRRSVEAAADVRFQNPATQKAALKEYWADQSFNYFMKTGKRMNNRDIEVMTESQFPGLLDSVGWGTTTGDRARAKQSTSSQKPVNPTVAPQPPEYVQSNAPQIKRSNELSVERIEPQQAGQVPASQPSATAPVSAGWHAPMVLPDQEPQSVKAQAGVTMDTITELGQKAAGILKNLDQSITPKNVLQATAPKMGQAVQEGTAAVDQKKQLEQSKGKDWNEVIATTETPEAQPFFNEKDPRNIQKAYNIADLHLEGEKEAMILGSTASAAKLNKLREDMIALREMHIPYEVLRDYQLYKTGQFGEGGMKGTSAGAMGGGFGGNWSTFERSARLSLEGQGIKGKALDEQIQALKRVDAHLGPLSIYMARAANGSRPAKEDQEAFLKNLGNLMDPNLDNSIAGVMSLQEDQYTQFLATLGMTTTKSQFMREKQRESTAGRMSPGDAYASKMAQLEAAEEFKKKKEAEEFSWMGWR